MTDKKAQTLQDVIDEPIKCHNCNGKGEVLVQSIAGTNHDGIIPCPVCHGQAVVEKGSKS